MTINNKNNWNDDCKGTSNSNRDRNHNAICNSERMYNRATKDIMMSTIKVMIRGRALSHDPRYDQHGILIILVIVCVRVRLP